MLFLSRLENNDMTDGRTDARTLHCIIYPSLYLSIVTCGQIILMKVCIAERVDFFMIYNVARLQPHKHAMITDRQEFTTKWLLYGFNFYR